MAAILESLSDVTSLDWDNIRFISLCSISYKIVTIYQIITIHSLQLQIRSWKFLHVAKKRDIKTF